MNSEIKGKTVNIKILAGRTTTATVDINGATTYLDILKELDINPETVIVLADGLPKPLDEAADHNNIEILRVVSGG